MRDILGRAAPGDPGPAASVCENLQRGRHAPAPRRAARIPAMKAMRFVGVGQLMQLQEVPEPAPQPGWAVLRVEAAGLCHSDLYILDGSLHHTMSTKEGGMLSTK